MTWFSTWIREVVLTIENTIFPDVCCHCQKLGSLLCQLCYEEIEFYSQPEILEISGRLAHGSTVDFFVAGAYQGPLGSCIRRLKYDGVTATAQLLADLLYFSTPLPSCQAIVPVPMHKKKETNVASINLSSLLNILLEK